MVSSRTYRIKIYT